ncbi:MAG: ribonuclease H family protein [Muribaculaceae bacterium]|nr:ribonuclease H family protein [Muribaculaceae bacterium]
MSSGKYYVVWTGRHPGVYDTWADCLEQVKNFPDARYKSYSSPAAAAEAYRRGGAEQDTAELSQLLDGAGMSRQRARKYDHAHAATPDYMDNPEVDLTAWAVDAACAGNPGPVEYRGVELMSGKELFRIGPLQGGTNNLGEFLAIVHALALQAKIGESHPIYSDSVSGMAWVRNRRIKTTLTPTPENERLFAMLHRALNWLNTNSYRTPIMKWDTPRWGEIPADFGRK